MSTQPKIDLLAEPTADEPEEHAALRRYLAGEAPLPAFLDEAEVEALIAALVHKGDVDRLNHLAASKDKAIAKAARRGIHLLRTRGVKADVAPSRRAEAPLAEPEPEPESLITAPLADGEYLVWYSFWTPSGRVQICEARIKETVGLLRFEMYRTSRKHWRASQREMIAESRLPWTRVPPAYARWLIEESYQRALAAGKVAPRSYAEMRAHLPAAQPVDRHPGLDVASEEVVRAIVEPERALDLPEAESWTPDEDSARTAWNALQEIDKSPIVLDDRQKSARRDEVIANAAAAALTAGLRARLSRRLLDLAYFITRESLEAQKGTRDFAADAALAVAGALHMEDPSVAPESNRIARRLYARQFEPLLKPEQPAPEKGSGGLLVTP